MSAEPPHGGGCKRGTLEAFGFGPKKDKKLCSSGCGRLANTKSGFPTCCRRCGLSGGKGGHDAACVGERSAAASPSAGASGAHARGAARCAVGCGRLAKAPYGTCCKECVDTRGEHHGRACPSAAPSTAAAAPEASASAAASPVVPVPPAEARHAAASGAVTAAASAFAGGHFISRASGTWKLHDRAGSYTFDMATGVLSTSSEVVGTFHCAAVAAGELPTDSGGAAELRCVTVTVSEIMAEIGKASNEGAYFVLPSQLNGAEYPSHHSVVHAVEAYKGDPTGGPRGQLAVHPAAGQFVLDNAACTSRPGGINAIDLILEALEAKGFSGFVLQNGYLKIPKNDITNPLAYDKVVSFFRSHLHLLRPLVMEGVLASGLAPSKAAWSGGTHRVSLVYASAVPVNAYLNETRDEGHKKFMQGIAGEVLVGQYFGALQHAAKRASVEKRTRVYLMPLGGGVFNNKRSLICDALSKAVEMLTDAQRARLDIHVLAWDGNPKEGKHFREELTKRNKCAL